MTDNQTELAWRELYETLAESVSRATMLIRQVALASGLEGDAQRRVSTATAMFQADWEMRLRVMALAIPNREIFDTAVNFFLDNSPPSQFRDHIEGIAQACSEDEHRRDRLAELLAADFDS